MSRANGKVYLIGAGPGDPELLTLKAVRALGLADVVLLDDLVDRALLQLIRSDARVIEVGKRGGCRSTPQRFIERLMLRCARAGKVVARVKGGHPFVFGRGGEEMLALQRAGIEVEVVSGLTAGISVPALLGIPVTHRGMAQGVTLLTGHAHDDSEPDWHALVRTRTTLVIYMGMSRLEHICHRLIEAGMPLCMPAAVVQDGTLPTQRSVVRVLGTLADEVERAGLGSPAVMIIGEVVGLAEVMANLLREVA